MPSWENSRRFVIAKLERMVVLKLHYLDKILQQPGRGENAVTYGQTWRAWHASLELGLQ